MPNWISSQIEAYGPAFPVQDMLRALQSRDVGNLALSWLETFLPAPADADEKWMKHIWGCGAPDRGHLNDWGKVITYPMNLINSSMPLETSNEYMISGVFETPWIEPIIGFRRIAQAFPEVTFILEWKDLGDDRFGTHVLLGDREYEEHSVIGNLIDENGDDGALLSAEDDRRSRLIRRLYSYEQDAL